MIKNIYNTTDQSTLTLLSLYEDDIRKACELLHHREITIEFSEMKMVLTNDLNQRLIIDENESNMFQVQHFDGENYSRFVNLQSFRRGIL